MSNALTYVGLSLTIADFDSHTGKNTAERLEYYTQLRHNIVHRGQRPNVVRNNARECVDLIACMGVLVVERDSVRVDDCRTHERRGTTPALVLAPPGWRTLRGALGVSGPERCWPTGKGVARRLSRCDPRRQVFKGTNLVGGHHARLDCCSVGGPPGGSVGAQGASGDEPNTAGARDHGGP